MVSSSLTKTPSTAYITLAVNRLVVRYGFNTEWFSAVSGFHVVKKRFKAAADGVWTASKISKWYCFIASKQAILRFLSFSHLATASSVIFAVLFSLGRPRQYAALAHKNCARMPTVFFTPSGSIWMVGTDTFFFPRITSFSKDRMPMTSPCWFRFTA